MHDIQARVRDLVKIAPAAQELAERFRSSGHTLFLVGGSVRDALLGRLGQDLDFATDARPEETLRIMKGWAEAVWETGIRFGTVGARAAGVVFEITTFRQERYADDSRHPDVQPVATIEDDLARRDFTVNAMAMELPSRRFVDPFGGLADLAARRLKTPLTPEESFGDDPLRMLRAARFVATLDLKPIPELLAAMASQRERLRIISGERIRDEMMKLLAAPRPSKGLKVVVDTGLAELFLPELPALRLEQDPIQRHKDVYSHTLSVVDRLAAGDDEPDVELRMAGLLHDIGKPATRRFGPDGVSFHHHEIVGAQMAEHRLRELRFPNEFIETVTALIEMHLRFHTFRMGWSDSAVRRYVRDSGPLLERLNRLVRADCTTRNPAKARQLSKAIDQLEERISELEAEEDLKRIRAPLDGNEVMEFLGIKPGKQVGEALAFLLEIRLEQGEYSKDDAKALLAGWATKHGLR